jgi:hypothetical protein
MRSEKDPGDYPGWHAIQREAALVRQLIGSGVTALGRASYANKTGEYYTAFFGLSVGLERLAKLILVADYAVSNHGRMPDEKVVRKFGHKLVELENAADAIAKRHNLKLEYSRPTSPISAKIVECLDSFADASRGRYANFASLGDPNLSDKEPIRKWWGEVAELILHEHYYGKAIQRQVEYRAKVIDELVGSVSFVLYTDESGDQMQSMTSASTRSGQASVVQRYGRFYVLTTVRWLSEIFSVLSRSASDDRGIHALYGVWEFFGGYRVEDQVLRTRKVWPLW